MLCPNPKRGESNAGKIHWISGGNKASGTLVASLYFSTEPPWDFGDHQVVDLTSLFRGVWHIFGPTLVTTWPRGEPRGLSPCVAHSPASFPGPCGDTARTTRPSTEKPGGRLDPRRTPAGPPQDCRRAPLSPRAGS